MNRDTAFPYILAERFLQWWREMGRPEIASAFHYWSDQQNLRPRRRLSVWQRVGEVRSLGHAA